MGLRKLFRRNRPLTCREVVELVTAYLDDAMKPAERARFEAHLADCDGCAAYLDQFRFTVSSLKSVDEGQLDPVFRARLMAAFAETTGSW
jgi:anti-sigma factor RsiW